MALTQERIAEISKFFIKKTLKRKVGLASLSEAKREFGEWASKSEFSKEEFSEFMEPLIREVFEDQMKIGFSFGLDIPREGAGCTV